jgi:NADH:ubiquinone oxidoreductase subunit 4 (subunit M)
MLWLLKRLFFGPEQPKWVGHLTDARASEKLLAYAMSAIILGLGLCPLLLTSQYQLVADRLSNYLLTKAQAETSTDTQKKWQ